jgi:DNA-binding LacI/PurR family transcriptional regulator
MRQTTVKDIANKLSLHYTTVSKALRDHPDISVETKNRVLTLAKELDYHPNSIAKSLKNHSTFTIGIIVPSIKVDFFSAVISGVEEVAYEQGFNTVVCQSNEDHEREVTHISTLISNRVDGVLVSLAQTTKSGAHIRPLQKKGIPLVLFDRVCEDIEADKVVVDDYRGAVKAVRHLIQSGYRNIAHIAGPENTSVGRDRCRGYVDELKRNGIAIKQENIIIGGLQENDGVTAFRTFASHAKMPEAIFAVNDPVAIGVYDEIKRCGLNIPQDIALIGFGNIKLSSYLDPPLTTVRQSPYKLGKTAAGMLLRRIENPGSKMEPKTEVIETELILREST